MQCNLCMHLCIGVSPRSNSVVAKIAELAGSCVVCACGVGKRFWLFRSTKQQPSCILQAPGATLVLRSPHLMWQLPGRPPSLALLCVLLALLVAARGEEHPVHERADSPAPAQAYASLLYSDDFLLGIRVLGQSLRETGTTRRAAVAAPPSPPHHCSLTSAVTSAILRNVRQPSRLPHKPSDV